MNDKIYVVNYTRHNKTTNQWAYKTEFGSANKNEAEKKAYALLGEFVGGDTFDVVNVIMHDSEGAIYIDETWKEVAE